MKKIEIEKSKATFELLISEFENVIALKKLSKMTSQVANIFGFSDLTEGVIKDLEYRSEKIKDRLVARSPAIKKRWETIKLTENRLRRSVFSEQPELMNTNFYCSKYTNAQSDTTCSEQCFDCVEDLGDRKLKKL